MSTLRNEKTFMQKFLSVVESMDTSPAEMQWQTLRQHAVLINALLDRVVKLETTMAALQPSLSSQDTEEFV